MLLEIFRKPLDRRLDRPRCRIAQGTKRLAFDVVAKIQHQLRVSGAAVAIRDAPENLYQPVRALATRSTPPA